VTDNSSTAKCIDEYIAQSSHNDSIQHPADPSNPSGDAPMPIDHRLQDIVERMFRRCYDEEDYMPAIGIAIEARRLDVVEEGIKLAGRRSKGKQREGQEKDMAVGLMEYVLEIAMSEVQEISLRERVCGLCKHSRFQSTADMIDSFCDFSSSSS
jgi:26S proteasome regulatory subunit N2